MCARICVSGGRPLPHVRRAASRQAGCDGLIEEEGESSARDQFIMPLLFAVDVKYNLPRSRAAFGARVEEVNKKKFAKAPRRAELACC